MSIHKLKNGKYLLYTVDQYGNKVRIRFYTRKDAEAVEVKFKNEKIEAQRIKHGIKPKIYLIEKQLEEYLLSKKMLRPKSYKKYAGVVSQIKIFCHVNSVLYIDQFTNDLGTNYYNFLLNNANSQMNEEEKDKRLSVCTINFYVQTLKSFFNEEVYKNHLTRSPVLHLRPVRKNKIQPDFFTADELKKFFSVSIPYPYDCFFKTLLYTGLRFGEAANLTWDDIDLETGFLEVKNKSTHALKTESSNRILPICEELSTVLYQLKKNAISEYLFVNKLNKTINERTTLEICKKTAKECGIKSRAYPHKFRSTFATMLTIKKVPVEHIQRLLGHSSVVTTQKHYANDKETNLHSEVELLNDLLKESDVLKVS